MKITITRQRLDDIADMANLNSDLLIEKYKFLSGFNMNSEIIISLSNLEKLSSFLKIPSGYFLIDSVPQQEVPFLEFRTINNIEIKNPSRELIDTIKDMNEIVGVVSDIKKIEENEKLKFVNSLSIKETVTETSHKILNFFDLTTDWNFRKKNVFRNIKTRISDYGIMVMQNSFYKNSTRRSFNLKEFRGFAIADDFAPLIFINTLDSINGRLFTLLHELVHIGLGNSDILVNDSTVIFESNNTIEQFCNEVAGELLMPSASLTGINIDKNNLTASILEISKDYNCSSLVVAIKLKKMRIISEKEFTVTYKELNNLISVNLKFKEEQKKNKKDSPKIKPEVLATSKLDINFLRLIGRNLKNEKILYSKAYEMVGFKNDTFNKIMKRVGNNV